MKVFVPTDEASPNAKVCATVVGAGSAEVDPNENAAGVSVDVAAVNFGAPNEKPAPVDDIAGGILVCAAMAGADPNEIDGGASSFDDGVA